MTLYRDELAVAVDQLDRQFAELKEQARQRLGDFYNANDYPVSLRDEFAMKWEFPAVEPPAFQVTRPASTVLRGAFSFPGSPRKRSAMTIRQLHQAVSRATGEDVDLIAHRGFTSVDDDDRNIADEDWAALALDWDRLDTERRENPPIAS